LLAAVEAEIASRAFEMDGAPNGAHLVHGHSGDAVTGNAPHQAHGPGRQAPFVGTRSYEQRLELQLAAGAAAEFDVVDDAAIFPFSVVERQIEQFSLIMLSGVIPRLPK
jgi:hypothetical protein